MSFDFCKYAGSSVLTLRSDRTLGITKLSIESNVLLDKITASLYKTKLHKFKQQVFAVIERRRQQNITLV